MDNKLLAKYLMAGLQTVNQGNYMDGLPDLNNEDEIKAFSKSLEMLGKWIAKEPGAADAIIKVLTDSTMMEPGKTEKEAARERMEAAHKRQLKAIDDIFKLGTASWNGETLYKPYGEIMQDLTAERDAAAQEYEKALKDYKEAAARERAKKG
jgi:hypothetical protein